MRQLVEEVGVGAVRRKVIVPAASSTRMPGDRSQCRVPRCARLGAADAAVEPLGRDRPCARHARAGGGCPRRAPARPSSTGCPAGAGRRRSGRRRLASAATPRGPATTVAPCRPPTRRKATRPSLVRLEDLRRRRCEDGRGVQRCPAGRNTSPLDSTMRRVPPRCCAPDARTPTHSDPSTTARPCGAVADRQRLDDRAGAPGRCGRPCLRRSLLTHTPSAPTATCTGPARAPTGIAAVWSAAARIDARHRAVAGVGHPQRSRAPREAARAAARRRSGARRRRRRRRSASRCPRTRCWPTRSRPRRPAAWACRRGGSSSCAG